MTEYPELKMGRKIGLNVYYVKYSLLVDFLRELEKHKLKVLSLTSNTFNNMYLYFVVDFDT